MVWFSGYRCRSTKREGVLCIERLEQRALLTHDLATGLGVVGDSLSDEYAVESYSYAKNWVELLAQEKQLNFGTQASRTEPRRAGYEFDWARAGATSSTLLSAGQLAGMIGQINAGQIGHAVLAIGQNDFSPDSDAYQNIYAGTWTNAQIDQHVSNVVANITQALATLDFSNVSLIVANIADYGVAPATKEFFPVATQRDRVTAVIQRVNEQIASVALTYRVPLVDLAGLATTVFGTNTAPRSSMRVGGITINNSAGNAATNAFVDDGIHPHTVVQAAIANLFTTAFNVAYGTTFPQFSEAQMVSAAGLGFAGSNTLNLRYEDYLQVPMATVLVDFGDGSPTNSFESRIAELTVKLSQDALTAEELASLKNVITTELTALYSRFTVKFVTTPPTSGSFETLAFGRATNFLPDINTGTLLFAKVDWLNDSNLNGTSYVFPAEFISGSDVPSNRSQFLAGLGKGLGTYGAQAIGNAFGLMGRDAYGDPRIQPANYADTEGVQRRDPMSLDRNAFDFTPFTDGRSFTFSPLSSSKFQFANNVAFPTLPTIVENPSAHGTLETAQAVPLTELTLRKLHGVSAADVSGAVLFESGESDWYQITGKIGDLLTANATVLEVVGTPRVLDPVLKLYRGDGTLLATNDDLQYQEDVFVPVSNGVTINTDAMLLNVPLPVTGTYYLEVTAKNGITGLYDLFVARTDFNPHPWQNPRDGLDVDDDGFVVPLDALRVINELNSRRVSDPTGLLPLPALGQNAPLPFLDVDGDGFVSPLDALRIINYLNSRGTGESEAADDLSSALTTMSSPNVSADKVVHDLALASLLEDEFTLLRRRRK